MALSPVYLGKEKSGTEMQKEFFEQVRKLQAANKIDKQVQLSDPDDFLKVLQNELGAEAGPRQRKLFGFIGGVIKDQPVIYVTYDTEKVGYFKIKKQSDMKELGMFFASFHNASKDISKEEIWDWVGAELQNTITQQELRDLQEHIVFGQQTRKEHVTEKRQFRKEERKLDTQNEVMGRKLLQKLKKLGEEAEFGGLNFQDVTMNEKKAKLDSLVVNMTELSNNLLTSEVTPQMEQERYYIKNKLIVTIVEIKVLMDEFKVPKRTMGIPFQKVFQKKGTDFDKELEIILDGMGFKKRGFLRGRSIWKDKRLKETKKYVKAKESLNALPGGKSKNAEKLQEYVDGFEQEYIDPGSTSRRGKRNASKGGRKNNAGNGGATGLGRKGAARNTYASSPYAPGTPGALAVGPGALSADPSATITASNFVRYAERTGAGRGKKASNVETPGIDIRIDRNGHPYAIIDKTKLSPRLLAEGYIIHKSKAESVNAPLRAKNERWNYGFAMVDEAFEHPESLETMYDLLGGSGGRAAGKAEFRDIMSMVLFDQDFKKSVKAEYRDLKNDLFHDELPPEWDLFQPDAEQDKKDALLQIAFMRQLPDKYRFMSSLFEKHTTGDHTSGMNRCQKIRGLFNNMGMTDMVGFIRDSAAQGEPAGFDLESDISLNEARKANGVTKNGGALDWMKHKGIEAVRSSNMPEGLKGFTESGINVLNKVGKFAYRGAGIVALGTAAWRGIRGIWNAGAALVTGRPQDNQPAVEGRGRLGYAGDALARIFVGNRSTTAGQGTFGTNFDLTTGALAPLALWMGLKGGDNAKGTQKFADSVFSWADDDRAARQESRKQINALGDGIDYDTFAPSVGVKETIGTITMGEIVSRGLLFGEPGKLRVNFANMTEDEVRSYPHAYNNKVAGNQSELNKLSKGFGDHLRENYMLSAQMVTVLANDYPNATLNELIKRFQSHEEPATKISKDIPKTMFSEDDLIRLRFMEESEYANTVDRLVFVAQQSQKLDPAQLDSYRGTTGGFLLPSTITSADIIAQLSSNTDGNQSALSWLNNKLTEIAQLPADADVDVDLIPLLDGYYKVMKTALSGPSLLQVDATTGTGVAPVRYYDPANLYDQSLAGYFHKPDIVNGSATNPYIANPTVGGLAMLGSTVDDIDLHDVYYDDMVTSGDAWDDII